MKYLSKFQCKGVILKLQVNLSKKSNLIIFNKLRERERERERGNRKNWKIINHINLK